MKRAGPMDLNYLFFRQQVERTRAEAAASKAARKAHEELAEAYEEQIDESTAETFSSRPTRSAPAASFRD